MTDHNIKNMDKALKEHYASISLSENQQDHLLMMQINAKEVDSLSHTKNEVLSQTTQSADLKASLQNKQGWWHRLLPDVQNYRNAFYVTAFLLLGCLFTVYNLLDRAPFSENMSQRIMSEIVYNHNQDMPIEIASSSLTDISEYLNKLSFSIVLPSALSEPNWQLLGGRYCSINGKLAAQLKVKNLKDNTISTFYQAAIDKDDLDKSGNVSKSDMIDGVGVSIWREQGLLQGLARETRSFIK